MRYARVQDGVVWEIITLPDGLAPADTFHPSLDFRPCNEEVAVGWIDRQGELVPPPAPPPPSVQDLQELKTRLKAGVDAAAEQERLKYITPGAGQAMTYQRKMEEVRALAQDADPDPANYPMLSAEIGITAPTLAQVADVVLAAYRDWQQVGAAIEGIRLGAKAAIDAAETLEAAAAAAVVDWPFEH